METAQLVSALFGEMVDAEAMVAKMMPDSSSVHVPGLIAAKVGPRQKQPGATVIRRSVDKGMAELVTGHLSRLKAMSGVHAPYLPQHAVGTHVPKHLAPAPAAPTGPKHLATKPDRATRKFIAARKGTPGLTPASLEQGAKDFAATPAVQQGRTAREAANKVPGQVKNLWSTPEGKTALIGGTVAAGYGYKEHQKVNYAYGKSDDRRKRAVTAGLSATGAVAGAAGLAYAADDIRAARLARTKIPLKTKVLIPLEVAGLGGELMATKILHGDAKAKRPVGKSLEFEATGTFSKFDTDKRLAFGWANVSKLDGKKVLDRQGDYIDIEDMEDAAYVFVKKSRVGGDMHRRAPGLVGKVGKDDAPHKVADLVESMVFTPEKIAKMGLPDDFPQGWWVGFHYHDDEAWEDIKAGRRTGFSIHGKGVRKVMDPEELYT